MRETRQRRLRDMHQSRKKTIEQLEGSDRSLDSQVWADSFLISRCVALRRKPLDQFTTEDLRIMIGQNIALHHLIPLALERLTRDLFLAGDFYPGDLLAAVLRAERAFWLHAPAEFAAAKELAVRALKELPALKTTQEIRASLTVWADELLALDEMRRVPPSS